MPDLPWMTVMEETRFVRVCQVRIDTPTLDWDGFNIDENNLPVLSWLENTYLELH